MIGDRGRWPREPGREATSSISMASSLARAPNLLYCWTGSSDPFCTLLDAECGFAFVLGWLGFELTFACSDRDLLDVTF